jgi:hypothetical protein
MTIWSTNATTIAGSPVGTYGDNSTLLFYPTDIFVDDNNTLYVLDGNSRVQRFLSNSVIGTTVINATWGSDLNQFESSKYIV